MESAKNGTINVDKDHKMTAIVSTDLPPYFRAALPPITYKEENTTKSLHVAEREKKNFLTLPMYFILNFLFFLIFTKMFFL